MDVMFSTAKNWNNPITHVVGCRRDPRWHDAKPCTWARGEMIWSVYPPVQRLPLIACKIDESSGKERRHRETPSQDRRESETARPPATLAVAVDPVPAELKTRSQWVAWRWEFREEKWTKVPLNPRTGSKASSTNRQTWDSFDEALARYASDGVDGIGFVVTREDPFVGIDLDDCRDVDAGVVEPWAAEWVERFGSYAEMSPTGTGVRIWIRADLHGAIGQHGRRGNNVEIYGADRYFTVTGRQLPETPSTIDSREAVLAEFLDAMGLVEQPRSTSTPRRSEPMSDERVLELVSSAANGEKFRHLFWEGDTTEYGSDDSAADLALLSILAFYTQDRDQLDRLFRQSRLYREKWEREDYRERTIAKALEREEVYQAAATRRFTRSKARGISASSGAADAIDATDATDDDPESRATEGRRKISAATQIVDMILDTGAELFHDANEKPYITVPLDGTLVTKALDWFGGIASRLFYLLYGKAPSRQALQEALDVLRARAVYDGPVHQVWTRLGQYGGALYLDVGNEAWQAIRIDATGWSLVSSDAMPVKFRRPSGMLPLPIPLAGGSFHDLDAFINVANDQDRMLIKSWVLGTFCLTGGRPILELLGEQGSSKSTVAKMLRRIVDPCSVPLRTAPREERDLMIAANNGLVVAFDNLSDIRDWQSDAFCRLSTGGGIGGRQLYTDFEEVVLDAQRPVLLTGINGVATRSDMLDRTISVTLPPIPGHRRRTEADLQNAFEQRVPFILGGLLDAVSAALRNQGSVHLERVPRLADFVIWVEAAAPALGWNPGQFADAFEGSRRNLDEVAIDGQAIGPAILVLTQRENEWTGTATELLAALNELTSDEERRERAWPRRAIQVSQQLERIAPNLRRLGIGVQRTRTGSAGTRLITLTRTRVDEQRQSRQDRQSEQTDVTLPPADATDDSDDGDAQLAFADEREELGFRLERCATCRVELAADRRYQCEACAERHR